MAGFDFKIMQALIVQYISYECSDRLHPAGSAMYMYEELFYCLPLDTPIVPVNSYIPCVSE